MSTHPGRSVVPDDSGSRTGSQDQSMSERLNGIMQRVWEMLEAKDQHIDVSRAWFTIQAIITDVACLSRPCVLKTRSSKIIKLS